jgi:hypothetical protein
MKQMLNLPVDCITYLQNQENMSACVTRLIRQEREGGTFEERVKRVLDKIFGYSLPRQLPVVSEDLSNAMKSTFNL